jgi:hypothetical protein
LLLVQQLAPGDAVDLRAQLRDAILVAGLHVRLPGDQAGEHVLAEGEVGGGRDAPDRHDHQRADHDPEHDRSDAQAPSGMHERIVGRPPPAGVVPTAGMAALMIVVIVRRRRSRHSRFPDGPLRDLTLRGR